MKLLLQRVSEAQVIVADETVGQIAAGLLAFVGFEPDDDEKTADWLADRMLGLRVFADDTDLGSSKMNKNVVDASGSILIVSQFTLAADTSRGRRPSFTSAASPADAERLYDYFVSETSRQAPVQTGRFGADMQVRLINDGPVTFLLEHPRSAK